MQLQLDHLISQTILDDLLSTESEAIIMDKFLQVLDLCVLHVDRTNAIEVLLNSVCVALVDNVI